MVKDEEKTRTSANAGECVTTICTGLCMAYMYWLYITSKAQMNILYPI